MAPNIFISLTVQDTAIAVAIRDALRQLLGESVQVHFSTSEEVGGGIQHGEDWFDWIVQKVRDCDFALILITPASVQKPWILWEAGAVHGAALAAGKEGLRKVRPLVYQLSPSQLPSPIRDSKVQVRRGDSRDDIVNLFTGMLDDYRNQIAIDRMRTAFQTLDGTIARYLDAVRIALLDAPALPETVVVEEWRLRLDALLHGNRASEVEHLHDWMEIAFGRDLEGRSQPLDMRIHNRLAELYLKGRNFPRAIQQLELSRQLAPRDIFVLRTLGRAYLESGDRENAKQVIDRIAKLDPERWTRNVECAALAARWYREGGEPEQAAAVLSEALSHNPESYYLANLLGEVWLEARQLPKAETRFRQALGIVERLPEKNVWTLATAANAAFVLNEDEHARAHLTAICAAHPDADALATVQRGLQKLAPHLAHGDRRLHELLGALRSGSGDFPSAPPAVRQQEAS